MYAQGRGLKVTAVSAMVVPALTGFSSVHGHGSRGRHGDDGGGCGNSRQDHDSSSASSPGGGASDSGSSAATDSDGSARSAGGGGGSSRPRSTGPATPTASATPRPLKNGTAVLVRCASVADPHAISEVRNPNGRAAVFSVNMTFKNGRGPALVDSGSQVPVPAKGRTTYRISAIGGGCVEEIAHCEVEPVAVADW